jgi:hypothetical protein
MTLQIVPVRRDTVYQFITDHHRHHTPPAGYLFLLGVSDGENLVGVATVGRPVARALDDGKTVEITRICTDGTKHAASCLIARCSRVSRDLGYSRVITYIRADETGVSLRAAGAVALYDVRAKSWDTPSRPRTDKTEVTARTLFEIP